MEIRKAKTADIAQLVSLAARTFGLACPPHMPQEDIDSFIAKNLGKAGFATFLADSAHRLTVGTRGNEIIAYLVLIDEGPTMFVSKCYVAPEAHGSDMASLLMNDAIDFARNRGAKTVQLAVNKLNARAIRFYEKSGFTVVGYRDFVVGNQVENDYVLERDLAGLAR